MQDVGRVHGFEGAEGLIDEVLTMIVGKILGADDTVHIRFHELLEHCQQNLVFLQRTNSKHTWIK